MMDDSIPIALTPATYRKSDESDHEIATHGHSNNRIVERTLT